MCVGWVGGHDYSCVCMCVRFAHTRETFLGSFSCASGIYSSPNLLSSVALVLGISKLPVKIANSVVLYSSKTNDILWTILLVFSVM